MLAPGSLQCFPSKGSSERQAGQKKPCKMKRVSDRGSQEPHNESQLLSGDLPFQVQAGSSLWCQDTSVPCLQSAGCTLQLADLEFGDICICSKDTNEGMSLATDFKTALCRGTSAVRYCLYVVCSRTSFKSIGILQAGSCSVEMAKYPQLLEICFHHNLAMTQSGGCQLLKLV